MLILLNKMSKFPHRIEQNKFYVSKTSFTETYRQQFLKMNPVDLFD